MKKLLVAFAMAVVATTASAQIAGSAHDFTTGGLISPVPVFSCRGCHTAHGATMNSTIIWAATPYTTSGLTGYSGTAFTSASAAKGIGACMSCHATNSFPALTGTMTTTALTLDLSNDHPVGDAFTIGLVADGFQNTITLAGTPAVAAGQVMTCASCHTVHNSNAGPAALLRAYAPAANICVACHNK
jgi:predicted CXXCH cytochrome family protein